MKTVNIGEGWSFRRGFLDSVGMLDEIPATLVNLPHDAMIATKTSPDAPGGYDSGYFNGCLCNYTKYIDIPKEWENEKIGLRFDGAMLNTTIEVNGSKVGEHHYGYSPFYIDITDYVSLGQKNRITINTNTGVQPSCRWYTGAGLYRDIYLCHGPRVYVKNDGVYLFTKEVTDDVAFIHAEIEVCNETLENRIVEVTVELADEKSGEVRSFSSKRIQINHGEESTAKLELILKNPSLWNIDTPDLYRVRVLVKNTGIYKTHFIPDEKVTCDETFALFGVRTITADAIRGLRINGKTVKLKGGCVHHDNGLLGAVSLYESEARKIKKLKEIGFNAIRTAHNPPSEALVEACDRLGMFIFDEAFDSWGMAKRPGDFSNHFYDKWEDELTAFIKRDRVHPSVIMWSIGNEIPERGGLSNGYSYADKLASCVKRLDNSRPLSHGICSFWSGLDDDLAKGQNLTQNAKTDERLSWDFLTEPFTNGLDVVGYNYMEDDYEKSHERFPERVILGSENFPREIGFRWPMVEKLPYVIGDFTWTAVDYIGEAGIGKSVFVKKGDPLIKQGPWAIMPPSTTHFPWRLANDADIDITGVLRPQGAYRRVVYGSDETCLYVQNPIHFDEEEIISMWGFTDVEKNWNHKGYEGKPIKLLAFSNADEVELRVNGRVMERKTVSYEKPLPCSVSFTTEYVNGTIEAVSFKEGKEVSRDIIQTVGEPSEIVLLAEKPVMKADGHDAIYVGIKITDKEGNVVPNAAIDITADVTGEGCLAGLGTGNPITEDNYSDNHSTTFRGLAVAIIRSGYKAGAVRLLVKAENIEKEACIELKIE